MRPVSSRLLLAVLAAIAVIPLVAGDACAIDFYEIQIYPVETTPKGKLELELHSNSVISASGKAAHAQLNPYQIHETLEATYGLTPHLEIGQYFATARLNKGNYEYAGSRTKIHFGFAPTDRWPIRVGGNIELAYMRRAAEENPLSLELRPILETNFRAFTLIANLVFEKPFRGPGTHRGITFSPAGELAWNITPWFTPAVEYYSDIGALERLPRVQRQQHFIVPALNFPLIPRLELNLGIGIGLTDASNGVFLKSIVGWEF